MSSPASKRSQYFENEVVNGSLEDGNSQGANGQSNDNIFKSKVIEPLFRDKVPAPITINASPVEPMHIKVQLQITPETRSKEDTSSALSRERLEEEKMITDSIVPIQHTPPHPIVEVKRSTAPKTTYYLESVNFPPNRAGPCIILTKEKICKPNSTKPEEKVSNMKVSIPLPPEELRQRKDTATKVKASLDKIRKRIVIEETYTKYCNQIIQHVTRIDHN